MYFFIKNLTLIIIIIGKKKTNIRKTRKPKKTSIQSVPIKKTLITTQIEDNQQKANKLHYEKKLSFVENLKKQIHNRDNNVIQDLSNRILLNPETSTIPSFSRN